MTAKVRRIASSEALGYLRMAQEFVKASEECLQMGLLKAAGLNAIHASISAADAVCVFYIRERASSPRHEDAAYLLKRSGAPGAKEKAGQLASVLALKNLVEYESRLLEGDEARTLVKRGHRLVDWAAELLEG